MTSKVCFITGSSKGIGKYISEYFLSNGNIVYGCSRGDATISHENYRHISLDISDEKAVMKAFSQIRTAEKKLDILINNAGLASMNHALMTPGAVVEKLFSTNVYGTFYCCREAAKLMMSKKTGRIVNFSTVAVPLRLEGEAIYAASKAAVISLTEVLAHEFSPFGVTVNAVGPTPIDTDLIKSVPKDKIEKLVERQAIKRKGTFDDVLNVIEFFVSDRSSFITGQTVFLGGVCF